MVGMTERLRALPKAHTHLHLDGGYPLAAVQRLARAQGGSFERPARFRDAGEFFTAYGTMPALVRDLDDLAALCLALVHAEAQEGVLYLEPSIEPQLYSPRLGDLDTVTRTIVDALQRGAAETGIEVGANLTVNTGLEAGLAEDLARLAARFVGAGITAFGTAGPDDPTGPRRFERAARVARDAGLQVVIHAGQTGGPVDGPASVRAALDVLGATRISHGVHAIHDPELLARLAAEGIVCDVCPASNLALGVAASLEAHPAPAMLAAGVPITLNADDPLWFGADITAQYEIARRVWGIDDAGLARIAGNGVRLPSLSAPVRARFEAALEEWIGSEADGSRPDAAVADESLPNDAAPDASAGRPCR